MASGKYPIFNRSKNPFNKNVRTPSSIIKRKSVKFDENKYYPNKDINNIEKIISIIKKGSVMYDENYAGIISSIKKYIISDYYESINGVEYYDIENDSTYYQDQVKIRKNIFHVNYILDIQNK